MIFYFSGTGNSLHVARTIAQAQGETLLSIAQALDRPEPVLEYSLQHDEIVGLVYPVYAWGPPRLVLDLIRRLKIAGHPFIFSICTCGDEEGQSTPIVAKALSRQGLTLASSFSLKMPNNYIIGFDVDAPEVANAKIAAAEAKLRQINDYLTKRQAGVFDLLPGQMAGLKSRMINPLFNRFAMSTRPFFATDACTSCGLCEQICPVHTIKVEGKPQWCDQCTQCLACLHRCPVRAIQYGKGTLQKGRYFYPGTEV